MGKPYEPFGRADRGRAYKPDLFRLYSDEVLVMRIERRGWASSWRGQANQSSGRSKFLSTSAWGCETSREGLAGAG